MQQYGAIVLITCLVLFVMSVLICMFEGDIRFAFVAIGVLCLGCFALVKSDEIRSLYENIETSVLTGVVREKDMSSYKNSVDYRTTIELENENGETSVITLTDSNLFNGSIIGSEVKIKKRVASNKKDGTIKSVDYFYVE